MPIRILPLLLLLSAFPTTDAAAQSKSGAAAPFKIDEAAAAAPPDKVLDPKLLPDVVGLHLGMPAAEALTAFKTQYKQVLQSPPAQFAGAPPALMEFSTGWNVLGFPAETVVVELTSPPQKPVVWRIWRRLGNAQQQMLHADVLEGLRKKYGPETAAFPGVSLGGEDLATRPPADAAIGALWWLFDEQGHRLPMPASGPQALRSCLEFFARQDIERSQTIFRAEPANEPATVPGICTSSIVIVRAGIGNRDILSSFVVDAVDMPLASRAARATVAMIKGAAANAQAQALQKAAENKPKF